MSNHEQTNATFRRMAPTEELMAYIRREGEQLRARHSGLCLVSTTLEKLGRRRLFGARVELQMSGGRLVAKARAEDPHDALQSAFRIVERSARERVDRRRHRRLRARFTVRGLVPAS